MDRSGGGSSQKQSLSLITDYAEGASSCGYCGSKDDTNWSYGMQADFMTVETYQALVDRGWRRSGRWVYKPLHSRTCCQLITIRLDVEKYQPTKDQKRVQRRWEAHLAGAPLRSAAQSAKVGKDDVQGASPKRMREESSDLEGYFAWDTEMQGGGKRQRSSHNLAALELGAEEEQALARAASPTAELSEQLQFALHATSSLAEPLEEQQQGEQKPDATFRFESNGSHGAEEPPTSSPVDIGAELTQELQDALHHCIENGLLPDLSYPVPVVSLPTPKQRKRLPLDVVYTSPTPLAVTGLANRAENGSAAASSAKRLSAEATAKLLLEQMRLPSGIIGADIANGHLNFKGKEEVVIVDKSASSILGTKFTKGGTKNAFAAPPSSSVPRSPARHFELRLLPSSDLTLPTVEFELYKKYQVMHHGDAPHSVTKSSFCRFLCDSPLVHAPASSYPPGGAPSCGFGSFHQQYWLDGKLIAVGVIDILPRCLSSKYLFWDPDLAPLSLGKLASLQEIAWVKEARKTCPSLRYYYLGFYLDNCHRMKYKAEFGPSDLLCPVHQCWVPIDRVREAVASGAHPPALAEVPGALDGLGEEYLVTADGQPALPPTVPSDEEVGEVKLFVGVQGGGGSGEGRRGQVVTFGRLKSLGVLREDVAARVQHRLQEWMMLVGPVAWRTMVYSFE